MKRVVVKFGTNLLSLPQGGLNTIIFDELARQVAHLKKEGFELIIVSSGAIGSGQASLGIKGKMRDIILRQACAAIGQDLLMKEWRRAFAVHQLNVAQLLLTYDSFASRKVYLNLTHSMEKLLQLGVIPIINENDAISTREIDASFGDNDRLSALVASKIDADQLIILSDIEGLYTKNPKIDRHAKLIRVVQKITPEIEAMGGKASLRGVGGMKTKIEAAKICFQAGVEMVIAKGVERDVLVRIVHDEALGTRFLAGEKLSQKARWIQLAPAQGKIMVDDGARKALHGGKSLLPAGVVKVDGVFGKGDVVELVCGRSFAKAISDYSSTELEKVKGRKGEKIVFKRENFVVG